MPIVPGLSLFMELLLCIDEHSFVKECGKLSVLPALLCR